MRAKAMPVLLPVLVAQSWPTLCDPTNWSPPGFSVYGISQARIWSGLPFPSPGGFPDQGIEPKSPAVQADSLLTQLRGKSYCYWCLALNTKAWNKYLLSTWEINVTGGNHTVRAKFIRTWFRTLFFLRAYMASLQTALLSSPLRQYLSQCSHCSQTQVLSFGPDTQSGIGRLHVRKQCGLQSPLPMWVKLACVKSLMSTASHSPLAGLWALSRSTSVSLCLARVSGSWRAGAGG